MIVRNEEDVLGRCLASVSDLMDEIIIADTGSTDRTKEIAAQYTEKIFDFPWIDDFSAARTRLCQSKLCLLHVVRRRRHSDRAGSGRNLPD